jgi:glyoxylase-like metal-dependent hydrolase (beta-lactamase superfamily II)
LSRLRSEVAAGIYVHFGAIALMTAENEGAIANVGFVVGDDALIRRTAASRRQPSRTLPMSITATAKPIKYVINTHGHPDHVFGNAAFEAPDGFCRPPQLAASNGGAISMHFGAAWDPFLRT